jgi:alpha-galactosidase
MNQSQQLCRLNSILVFALLAMCLAPFSAGQVRSSEGVAATIRTTDVRLELKAGEHAPMLVSLVGPDGAVWRNAAEEDLPASVDVNGLATPVRWTLRPELIKIGRHRVDFIYESAQPHMRLDWRWEARYESGPIEHRIRIENLNKQEIWLPLVDSLRLDWRRLPAVTLHHFYVEKGADTPSAQGTHLATVSNGYRWIGRSSTYAHPVEGEGREIIPVEFVYSSSGRQAGWYSGIEFSGRTRITLEREGDSLRSRLGLNGEPGPFRTRLEANGSFETPTVFLGAFADGVDGAGNQLRPWVRAVLNNPLTWKDPRYPLTVSNSWGSGMQVDEALALRMMTDAKELGLEMFHLDAGWFRGVGDWYPDPRKFPHGVAFVADQAHLRGLRFGMWVDWSQAGIDTAPGALNAHDPQVRDWLVNDVGPDWKPEEFKGQTIDLGVPAAKTYAAKEVKRIVEDYHLDMLEHDGYLVAQGCIRDDHPHAAPNHSTQHITRDSGFDFVSGSNSTDVSYHAVQSYYDIQEQLRREHPGLLLEICNDGGRMVDFGSAAHGDYFSITDTYDPLSNRRAFYDTSYALPPAMLESYIEKWPVPRLDNFKYMLRSGMMGWMTMMLDTTTWTLEQHDAAKRAIALYKDKLRPLIRDAHLYHVSERPDGIHWDGMEYWDPQGKRGVLFAFRGSIADESSHAFQLAGLDSRQSYRLHFEDGSAPDRLATGAELMASGLAVHLNEALSSELVFLDEAPAGQ